MKVKAINRSEVDYKRDRVSDLHKVHKNLDPALHPFEKAVEYTRGLNAVKLDRCDIFINILLLRLMHFPANAHSITAVYQKQASQPFPEA